MGFWNKNDDTKDHESEEADGEAPDSQDVQEGEVVDGTGFDDEAQDSETPQPEGETDWKNEYVLLMSEFDNFRKRTRKDMEALRIRESVRILKPILDSLDNFERAFEMEHDGDSSWAKGLQDSYNHLLQTVTGLGVEEIDALYKPFDPDLHEAIGCHESDKLAVDTIAQVVQKGYRLKDGPVIRYARVIVVS